MKHIVYMSRATRPLTDSDLEALLAQCRRDNQAHDITGVLFYSHGNIAQLFEGEPTHTDPLFERISRDPRHTNVTKLIDAPITQRSFADWHMAFHPLEAQGFEALQGFLLPQHMPPPPTSLSIADSLLVELVRLAVFGPDPSQPYHQVLPGPLA